jgi:pSer/pThr/pTyr-binding forkhead associated (FHA) protein
MSTRIRLTCTEGKLQGKQIDLVGPHVYSVGRAADCDLHIPRDPDCQAVSRHHCLLMVDMPKVSVYDCGSRNGTFVNETWIGHQATDPGRPTHCNLTAGDKLRLGNLAFRVEIIEDKADPFEWPLALPKPGQAEMCDLSPCI